jgi:hypothetical protein
VRGVWIASDGASMNFCRYSDEPFNTNEIIWPHWRMVPSHPPTAILAMATFAALGVAIWAAWPRREREPAARRDGCIGAPGREPSCSFKRKRPALREAFLISKA